MKQLWTPWRMKFIMDSKKPTDGCVFCHLQTLEDGPENLILYRDETSFVLINKYPYNTGHLLVIPKQHEADLAKLEPAVLSSLMENIQRSIEVLKKTYHPAGFNVGSNLGATAGAGIPEHLHFHIVPPLVR